MRSQPRYTSGGRPTRALKRRAKADRERPARAAGSSTVQGLAEPLCMGRGPGDHVVITGASSGVGTAAIQTALRLGAIPIATTRGEAKRQRLLELGAAHVITTGSQDVVKEVRRFTGGKGAEGAFDGIGGPGFATLGDALAPGGTAVLYGWLEPRPTELSMNWPQTVHTCANGVLAGTEGYRRRASAHGEDRGAPRVAAEWAGARSVVRPGWIPGAPRPDHVSSASGEPPAAACDGVCAGRR